MLMAQESNRGRAGIPRRGPGSSPVNRKSSFAAWLLRAWDHAGPDIGLQHHEHAHEQREEDTVPEDRAENCAGGRTFRMTAGGDAGHDDALRIDHLAHHATRTVRGAHEDRGEPKLLGGYLLQIAEEDIGRCVA